MTGSVRRDFAAALRTLARAIDCPRRASPPTSAELDKLVSHIAYEVAALELAVTRLGADRLALEALLVHVRSLRDFFWGRWDPASREAANAVVAVHYFQDPASWVAARGDLPSSLARTRRAINSQLAHLTRARVSPKAVDIERELPLVVSDILSAWKAFQQELESDPRGQDFNAEYSRWKALLV